jgi:hypothetical protein
VLRLIADGRVGIDEHCPPASYHSTARYCHAAAPVAPSGQKPRAALPVDHDRPRTMTRLANSEDPYFVRFYTGSTPERMSTHCEVLTSQVTGTSQSMNDSVIGGHDQRLAPDHLTIITESGEINSIRHVCFLTGYFRNLRPLGHDYPCPTGYGYLCLAGHDVRCGTGGNPPFSQPDRGRPIRFRSHLPRAACGGHRHQHRWSSDRSLNSQSAGSR